MPTYRPDLDSIPRYVPGRPIEEVARELGIASIDKLASNECPEEPFAAVLDAIGEAASGVNRYPDSAGFTLTRAIAEHHGLRPESVWIGAGSSEILLDVAHAVGGPGTSAVYGAPSFVMYTIGTMISRSDPITVPLTDESGYDLDAMRASIRDDTTVVYVCNPNNPTGGFRSGADVVTFIESVPDTVTVVVDEAYAEYVTDETWETMLHRSVDWPNVLVARTFSKVYGLAGLRVGYAVGDPHLIDRLRTTQAPFTVNSLAQVAAIEALRHQSEVAMRRERNDRGRRELTEGLTELGYDVGPSQANFVYFEPDDAPALGQALLERGEIVRVLGRGVRVSVGTPDENRRFLDAIRTVGAVHA